MQWRNFLLTGAFFVLLLLAHACSPEWQDENKNLVQPEVAQVEPAKPPPLPIQFVPEPKPEAKPKPKPPPVKPKKAEPAAKKENKPGSGKQANSGLNVVGRFDCSVTFYLEVMMREGARLLLYEQNGPHYYNIDWNGSILPLEGLEGDFAPIARNLTLDHPQAQEFIRTAEQLYGEGLYDVVLLIPSSVQGRIDRMVEQVVPSAGKVAGTVSVRYQNSGGTLLVEFEEAVINGETVALNRRIAF